MTQASEYRERRAKDIVKLARDRAMYLRGRCNAYTGPVPHGWMEMGLASVLFDDLAAEIERLRALLTAPAEPVATERERHLEETFGTAWICSEVRRVLGLPDRSKCARYLEAIERLRQPLPAPPEAP